MDDDDDLASQASVQWEGPADVGITASLPGEVADDDSAPPPQPNLAAGQQQQQDNGRRGRDVTRLFLPIRANRPGSAKRSAQNDGDSSVVRRRVTGAPGGDDPSPSTRANATVDEEGGEKHKMVQRIKELESQLRDPVELRANGINEEMYR